MLNLQEHKIIFHVWSKYANYVLIFNVLFSHAIHFIAVHLGISAIMGFLTGLMVGQYLSDFSFFVSCENRLKLSRN